MFFDALVASASTEHWFADHTFDRFSEHLSRALTTIAAVETGGVYCMNPKHALGEITHLTLQSPEHYKTQLS